MIVEQISVTARVDGSLRDFLVKLTKVVRDHELDFDIVRSRNDFVIKDRDKKWQVSVDAELHITVKTSDGYWLTVDDYSMLLDGRIIDRICTLNAVCENVPNVCFTPGELRCAVAQAIALWTLHKHYRSDAQTE